MRVPMILILLLAAASACARPPASGNAEVIAYPAVPGLSSSDLFQVRVNDQEVWTEKFRTHMDIGAFPEWFVEPYTSVQQEVHQASFAGTGTLDISVRVRDPIRSASIHPLSSGIKPHVSGNVLTFSLLRLGPTVVQIDNLPPLFLFANAKEDEPVSSTAPGVHYFGPGIHRAGYITLKDSETVYIAAGAVVYGGIRANGAHHIRILGSGILDGDSKFSQMVLIENSNDVLFQGLMIRNGDGWTNTLRSCEDVTYLNVKVLSFGPAGDGIDPLGSKNVRIQDCFMRCTDDCIAIKAPDLGHDVRDVIIQGCTMIGFAFSDGVTIGFETDADSICNVTVRDCDVLLSRGGSRVEGHSGFSIICDGPADIRDVLYDNIRVEKAEVKLFELNITDGTKYGSGPPGHIENVVLRNISWAQEGPIPLTGFSESHKIKGVTFENCTVAGRPLRDLKSKLLHIGSFVEDVVIK